MKEIFDGVKKLDADFWRALYKNPSLGITIVFLALFFFFADLLYIILTPARVRRDKWGEK